MAQKNIKHVGKGIALGSLTAAAVLLELNDKPVDGLWLLIVLFMFFADWD